MSVGYVEPLRQALAHTRRVLLAPFDLGRWLSLGFVSWVAYLGSSGGSGWNGIPGGGGGGDDIGRDAGEVLGGAWQWLLARPLVLAAIVTGVALLIAVAILLLWLSSRFRLIFLEDVLYGRDQVIEPWRRLGALGDSLFWWRLGFGLAVLVAIVLSVGTAILVAAAIGWGWVAVPVLAAAGLVALTVVLAAVVIGALLDNFVVPIMYKHGMPASAAWRVLLPWLQREPGAFLVYLLFLLVLSIGVAIAALAFGLATCCIGLVLLVLPYIGAVLLLPVRVAYRAYGPLFLAQLDPDLAPLPAAVPPAAG